MTMICRCLIGWFAASAALSCAAADWTCSVKFTQAARAEPFTGRVTLFFSEKFREPRFGPDWFQPEPFVSLDVVDWQPETALEVGSATPGLLRFPGELPDFSAKAYKVQAVARFNPWERRIGNGPGNGYSAMVDWPRGNATEPVQLSLVIDRLVPEETYRETEWNKLVEVASPSLTRFSERPVSIRAGAILPASYYTDTERRYPVIYTIPGFGGSHRASQVERPIAEQNPGDVEFIRVILDPSCPWGHHVFADSANNGPWGTALVTEWLPEFERRFRVAPRGRFLTGHSSGGWSSLWLQITWPEVFDGVWSTAPDSVDFRDFQQANIYRERENAWVDPQGQRRPIARRGNSVAVWWDDFDRMEQVLGYGGQFQSFEAVFSPRGDDGRPRPLWNRNTGDIDPVTAEAWQAYDIRRTLQQNWEARQPQLQGKLRLFMGAEDTFYLNGAAALLKTALAELGSDAVIEIQAGKDHGSLLTTELRDRIRREMAETFLKNRE